MYIEIGPASLVVNGEKNGRQYKLVKHVIEGIIRNVLKDISDYLPVLKQRAYKIKNVLHLPEVAKRMTEAAKMIDEASLTPMAAVAGAVSDMVKERLKAKGLEFVSVNNGGDLSIFNKNGRMVRIGIGNIMNNKETPYVINVKGINDFGVATSGFGGRSLTLGLADIVTVIGKSGAIADAAATYICNCTNVETDKVMRRKASEIDPNTDIPNELVTVQIYDLGRELVKKAMGNGLSAAKNLKKNDLINDAMIIFKEEIVTTVENNKYISLEVYNGN